MTFIFFNKYPRKRRGPVEIGRLSSPSDSLRPEVCWQPEALGGARTGGEGVDEGGGRGRRAPPDQTPFLKSQVLRVYSLVLGVCSRFGVIFWSLAANFGAKARGAERSRGSKQLLVKMAGPRLKWRDDRRAREITWPPFSPSSGTPGHAASPSHATEIIPKRLANAVT